MVHNKMPFIGMTFAGAVLAMALTGCQTGSAGPNPAPGVPDPSAPAPSSGGGAGTGGAPANTSGSPAGGSQAAPVPNGHCTAGDLRLTLGGGDAAAGTAYRTLVFTNVSGHSCTVQGYPGVSYVGGDDGHQVGAPAARDGSKSSPIRLGSGQAASAGVGMVNVHNFDSATCRPQPVRGLRVYSPGETRSKFVALSGTGCANAKVDQLTIKPLQAGSGQ